MRAEDQSEAGIRPASPASLPCGRNPDAVGQSGAGIRPASIASFLRGRNSDAEGQSEAGIRPASASFFSLWAGPEREPVCVCG